MIEESVICDCCGLVRKENRSKKTAQMKVIVVNYWGRKALEKKGMWCDGDVRSQERYDACNEGCLKKIVDGLDLYEVNRIDISHFDAKAGKK